MMIPRILLLAAALVAQSVFADTLVTPAGSVNVNAGYGSIVLPIGASTDATLATRTKPADNQNITIGDSPSRDSFGRLRVSNPTGLFDSQFTYDLQPLLFQQITSGTGASIAWSSQNRNALFTFASTPTGGSAIMQSYQYFRYQPGKSQSIHISFNHIEAVQNVLKFVGYSDGANGIEFQSTCLQATCTNATATKQFVIYSGTASGNQVATQANWNLDKLDGTGPSGITLDITKNQILVIDLQALYTGRVRVGFDIGGTIVYVHQFLNSNTIAAPYIQTANLPIRAGMTNTGTASTTMTITCSSVVSEGGTDKTIGNEFSQSFSVVAANGVRTHALSVQPKLLFNGVTNRIPIYFIEISILVTGNTPVTWDLSIGQALTGTTTFADVNTAYSSIEYNTAGTVSGAPAIIVDQGFVPATNQSAGTDVMIFTARYPITLDAAGLQRLNGRITLTVTGLGATSQTYGALKWVEVR